MKERNEILKHLIHYEEELSELHNLLNILNNTFIQSKINKQNAEQIQLVKNHTQYLCFFISCFLDQLTILKSLIDSETNWDRKFYLKSGIVSIYETVKTYNKHQKELRKILSEKYGVHQDKYLQINLKLKEFKKVFKYDTVISEFRNKAGAHYDENFILYYENLITVDNPIYLNAIWLFSNFLMALIDFWGDLIETMKSMIVYSNDGNTKNM